MPLTAGTHLGPYEILAAIGAGGMGEVYRATDTRLKREVAIKVLPDALASDPDRVARFQREAELLASLNHPSIAAIYGLEQSGATLGIVLELVDGDTLDDKLQGGRADPPIGPPRGHTGPSLQLEETLSIARQICDALEAAHEKGVVHRDLKPANIKITPEGRVKVLDFGLAKLLSDEAVAGGAGRAGALTMSPTLSVHATYAGMILGTAAYMSPEQARGKPVDRRTDVWAFGCVLYEMLTGKRSFEPGETVSDAIVSVLSREPDWNALPTETPAPIRRLLRRCLQKDPQQRLPHIGAARLEIDDALSRSEDEVTVPGTSIARTGRPLGAPAIAVAAGIIVVGGIAGYAAWTLKPPPARAIARFTITLPEDQAFTNSGRRLVTLSPDGSTLAYVANRRLWLRALSALEPRAITSGDRRVGITNPTFSPDGQSVAFWSDGVLQRQGVSGGVAVALCPATNPVGLSWDERGLFFGQTGRGIVRVSPTGGTPELIVPAAADESLCCPQLMPGGKTILFSRTKTQSLSENIQIVAQVLETGARKVLTEGGVDGRYLPSGHLVYAMSGSLVAVPFDAARLEFRGAPAPVIEGVRRTAGTGSGVLEGAQFSYSTTGTLAYLPGPVNAAMANLDLALFDRNGAMHPLKLPAGLYRSPRVSPNGRFVAFDTEDARDAIVWTHDLSGATAVRRLTLDGRNRAPVWSPDGVWIAFQSNREGDLAVFRQRADGSGVAERLTRPEAGESHTPQSWSPDGRYLLLMAEKRQQYTLQTLRMTDRQIAAFDDVQSAIPTEAAFSPDGRWVAYQSYHTRETAAGNTTQVFVQPFPPTREKYLVPQNGAHPYWLRTGNALILNWSRTQSFLIPVTTSHSVTFGKPEEFPRVGRLEPNVFARRNVDAMPDGERVIGVTTTDGEGAAGAERQMIVVLNWLDEVRQRVPAR